MVPPPHHVRPVPPSHLPAALIAAKFIFVHKNIVIPTLIPQCLQIGLEQDSVSVDCLKPAFSDDPTCTTYNLRKTSLPSHAAFFRSSTFIC